MSLVVKIPAAFQRVDHVVGLLLLLGRWLRGICQQTRERTIASVVSAGQARWEVRIDA